MVTNARRLNLTFGALADPTRRAILGLVPARGDATVGELARPFREVSRPAVSEHLRRARAEPAWSGGRGKGASAGAPSTRR